MNNLTSEVAIASTRKDETEEGKKDVQQTHAATAETVLTPIQNDLLTAIQPSDSNRDATTTDLKKDDVEDNISEWDGESIDSAEIDARLRRQTG